MATKEEIEARVARRLVEGRVASLTWAQLVLAVQGTTQAQRDALVEALQARHAHQAGDLLLRAVRTWAQQQAAADAATMLADDQLGLAELEQILRA